MDYAKRFSPHLNPLPPADLMVVWERDYNDLQGNMIAEESLPFDEMMREIELLT